MVDPFIITRDAHALRVLFRCYLRERGFDALRVPREWIESDTGVTPDGLEAQTYFLEWLLECPDIARRVEFVERHYLAATDKIRTRRTQRR